MILAGKSVHKHTGREFQTDGQDIHPWNLGVKIEFQVFLMTVFIMAMSAQ